MPTPREDKRAGRLLPTPVTPPTDICFKITIPNAVQYRAALFGVLNQLGEWSAWDHPLDGTIPPECEEAAQLWRNAIARAVFDEECGGDMSCQSVADCIDTNNNVKNSIQNIINSAAQPQSIVTPGQPMTVQQVTTPLNPVPAGCNLDELWAQCEQLIDYMANATTDTLEYIETYSNAIEGAQFIEMAPFLGTAVDEAQIDQVLEFLDWIISNVKEYFDAANTQPARQEIACSLFCVCRVDCEITVQRMWNVLNARLGGILNPSEIDSLDKLLEAAVALVGNSSIALDLGMVVITGFAKFAGYMGIQGIDKTLNLVLKVAMNDANNDWMLLCAECADDTWCYLQNLKTDTTYIDMNFTDQGISYQTQSTASGITGAKTGFLDETITKITPPAPGHVTKVTYQFMVVGDPVNLNAFCWINGDTSTPFITGLTAGLNELVFNFDTDFDYIMFGIDRAGLDRTQSGYLENIKIEGTGTNPFGSSNC